MSGICIDCFNGSTKFYEPSLGVTELAHKLVTSISNQISPQTASFTERNQKIKNLISELIELHSECKEDGWDDEDASGIKREALLEALRFIELIPENVDLPEVAPAENGSIDLEWNGNNSRCNIEISGTEKVVYSAYYSTENRDFGIKPFVSRIPENILDLINKIRG